MRKISLKEILTNLVLLLLIVHLVIALFKPAMIDVYNHNPGLNKDPKITKYGIISYSYPKVNR